MIMAEAKRRGVEIYFGVEAGVLSDHHSWTTSAVWVKTPVEQATKAHSVSILSRWSLPKV